MDGIHEVHTRPIVMKDLPARYTRKTGCSLGTPRQPLRTASAMPSSEPDEPRRSPQVGAWTADPGACAPGFRTGGCPGLWSPSS